MAPATSIKVISTLNQDNAHLKNEKQNNRSHFSKMLSLFGIDTSEATCLSISWAAIVKLITITVVMIGTYLTITMGIKLLSAYQNDPPIRKITVFINDTVELPFVKVYLPLNTIVYLQNIKNTSYQDAVKSYLNNSSPMSAESFLGTALWPKPFLHVANEYLAFLRNAEIIAGARDFEKYKQTSSDKWQSFLLIEDFLVDSSITTDRLKQKFGKDVMQIYNTRGMLYWTDSKTSMNFSLESTIAVTSSYICVKSQPHIPFNFKVQHGIALDFNRPNFLSANTMTQTQNIRVRFDLIDEVSFDIGKAATERFIYGLMTTIKLQLPAVYSSLPEVNGEKKCSTTTPEQTCRSECRADYIRKQCECNPVAWPELSKLSLIDKQSCSLRKLEACHLSPDIDFSNCSFKDTCLPFCTQGSYVATATTYAIDKNAASTFLQLGIAPNYPLYEEMWPWTTESFVGAFGGVLGFWLGLDILMLFDFFITTFGLCIRTCRWICEKKRNRIPAEKGKRPLDKNTTQDKENGQVQSFLQKNRTRVGNIMKTFDINTSEKTCQSILRYAVVKLLWVIIVVIGTYLTITMCIALLHSYKNDPPYSKITTKNTFDLPSMRVCLPTYTKLYLEMETNTSYQDAVKSYLNNSSPMSGKSFLGTAAWPKPFLHVAQEYIAFLREAEIYAGAKGFEKYKQISSDKWQSFLLIEDFLADSSITTDQLIQKFGKDIMRMYNMRGVLWWYNNETTTSFEFVETLAVSPTITCVRSQPHVPFEMLDKHDMEITFDSTSMLPETWENVEKKIALLYRLSDYPDYDLTKFSTTTITFGVHTKVMLYVSNVFSRLPEVNGVEQCSMTSVNTYRCNCRLDYVRQMCGCEPTAWPTIAPVEKQYCSLRKLDTCQLSPDVDFSNCTTSIYPTLRQLGAYQATIATTPLDKAYAKVTLQLLDRPSYPSFEETLPWTTETFVGAFGGVLGMWIGLDALVLFELFLSAFGFCGRMCRRIYDKKKNRSDG
uniref:Uncharacterized protein n=1 Tax=Plectus sambesii TaxID=2011161 RepID=A0A914W2C4_9BILA